MVAGRFFWLALGLLWLAAPASGLELRPHPRLYINSQGTGKVPGVEQLRGRIAQQEYAVIWERVKSSGSPADIALCFLLTGDTTRLAGLRKALDGTVDRYENLVERSLAYDWAYEALSEQERKAFAGRLIESAEKVGEHYDMSAVYHNYCRGRHMGQGMAVLAAWDDDPRAQELWPGVEKEMQELLKVLGDGYPDNDMAGRAGWGGGWPEGYDYDRHGALYAIQILLAWRSAGLGDLISNSNYWRDKIYWIYYGTSPDGSFLLPYEDNDFPMVMPHDREMMTFLAGEFGSGAARFWIEQFADTLRVRRPYWDLLFFDPSVKKFPDDPLPTSWLIPGVGLALMRDCWCKSAAFLSFHCGPWYTYHQHAAQGSFTLFRFQPLVIEPGVYDGSVHEHYVNWRIRTISHNCILVMDPDERFRGPGQVPEPANDGGQIVQNWTLKPSTVAEWRAQRKMRETGKVTVFLTDRSHDFAAGEAAGAYNPDKVRRWCRQILFIKPEWIVLCDLVVSARADFEKTFIMHTQDQLLVENNLARTRPSGRAFVTAYSLLPRGGSLQVAGGPGKTFAYGGNNWETIPAYNGQHDIAWRLEIKAPPADTTIFLTALYVPDLRERGDEIPQVELTGSSPERVALSLANGEYRVELDPRADKPYRLSGPDITYAVMGAVRKDGLPVSGAQVTLEGETRQEALTDYHGRFAFIDLSPGKYRVRLEGLEKIQELEITDHSLGEVNFE